jgi:hypothetical protein
MRAACHLLHDGSLLGLFFDPEDGGDVFLRNVGWFSTGYTGLYPKRQTFSNHHFTLRSHEQDRRDYAHRNWTCHTLKAALKREHGFRTRHPLGGSVSGKGVKS